MGRELNLKNPILYNEKLQWLKLYDRNPKYSMLVDKYEVKKYIGEVVGEEHIIPTYGVWERFEDIDFNSLPNQFVLKCTHDSGGIVICKDKCSFDLNKVKPQFEKLLKTNYYYRGREWPYKAVKPRIIAEKYMIEDQSGWLTDYKFFCFNGQPKIVYVSKDKAENPTTDFFDSDFKPIKMRMRDPNSVDLPKKPDRYEEMLEMAKMLSKGMPHVRVDFYYINGVVYVGELTFYHCGGMAPIHPEEWAKKMGEWIDLSLAHNYDESK